MPKLTYTCQNCSKQFKDYPSQNPQYCSASCFREYRAKNDLPMKPKTGRHDPCEMCGEQVWRTLSDQRKGVRRFCSVVCRNRSMRVETVERSCDYCGTSMTLRVTDPRRRCSKRCDELRRIKRPLDRTHNGLPARLDGDGYVWVWEPDHPDASKYNGWLQEHRLVGEQMVGERLTPAVDVHHINRVKHDNRPENLAVIDPVTHSRFTANERLTDRRLLAEYLRRFGPIDA